MVKITPLSRAAARSLQTYTGVESGGDSSGDPDDESSFLAVSSTPNGIIH